MRNGMTLINHPTGGLAIWVPGMNLEIPLKETIWGVLYGSFYVSFSASRTS